MNNEEKFLQMALELARNNVTDFGGRPFGAVIVKNGEILATGVNEIVQSKDPTAHAELLAIRRASQKLQNSQLVDCQVFASGQPCPMCLSAMHMCGIKDVFFVNSNQDAESYGLSSARVYRELMKPLEQQSLNIVQYSMKNDLYDFWRESVNIG